MEVSPEVLFGGAAGGGKSEALLMAALQFVTVPGYAAILFRRTYADLAMPGALMSRANGWLAGKDVRWADKEKTWHFPTGATLTFGYLDNKDDRYRYQSTEFQFVGFDELTHFLEVDYTYLFSRIRRLKTSNIPTRMRAGTNPGGRGHSWVKKRFLAPESEAKGRVFIPSKLIDNPSLDAAEYTASLGELDSFTRNQLLKGDWTDFKGNHFFPGQWPEYVPMTDAVAIGPLGIREVWRHKQMTVVVAVDWATSEKDTSDYTAMVVGGILPDGRILILDVVNERLTKQTGPLRLAALCERWKRVGEGFVVVTEDDSHSQWMVSECRRLASIPEMKLLPIESRAKIVRATPAIIHAENGRMLRPASGAPWWDDFSDQLSAFTGVEKSEHDDMVDATGMIARMADKLKPTRRMGGTPSILMPGPRIW